MQELILPLVESIVRLYPQNLLSKVKVIGAQHILETTHAMFRSLYKLGLKPENVALIGKCYSTSHEVMNEMIADGIHVWAGSTAYSSYLSYDVQYQNEVEKFLLSLNEDLQDAEIDLIIVLDDGGKCINFINTLPADQAPIIAVEQTSAGYEAIRNKTLAFPVINVARSPAKLTLESPMIAQAAAERLHASLVMRNIFPNEALIIGGGAIGMAMKKKLETEMDITIYDQNHEITSKPLPDLLSQFPLIIGCTGKTSVPAAHHDNFSDKSILVSVSSSDREFDAAILRRKVKLSHDCHEDLLINNTLLVNSGFPVNFDGERENIHPDLIQLTIALITAAIVQAASTKQNCTKSIIPVSNVLETKIVKEFNANWQMNEKNINYRCFKGTW